MDSALVTAALVALACGVLGLGVPALIGRIPEPPAAEEGPAADRPDVGEGGDWRAEREAKEPYADIARLPGLAWKAALAAAVAGGLVGWSLGWAWELVYLVPLVPIAVALSVVDWRTRLLPTVVIAPSYLLVVVGVLACFAATRDGEDLVRAGYGWLIAGGGFWLLWRIYPRGMGYGDVRLSGVLGIALGQLGWAELVVGLYSSFLLGGIIGAVLAALRVVDRRGYPFGPFMLLGALTGIVLGHVDWSALVL